ncbi:MAG: hypothetical protein H0V33_13355 [Acidimicrobiia bacterium]|jgi:hypothetical protein|nr:hypothetical protein [Acidimicrobiia bacterium]
MERVGGNLEDIDVSAIAATEAGSTVTEGGQQAQTAAQTLVAESEDVINTLSTNINTMADTVRTQVTTTQSTIEGGDVDGNSAMAARAAAAELTGQVDTVVNAANDSVTQIRTYLMNEVTRFQSDVIGDLQAIMSNVDLAFQDLSAAQTRLRENLDLADQSIRMP